eukprot:COSAG04_NODE_13146_length_618_cov_1.175337_1_plen_73_part_00
MNSAPAALGALSVLGSGRLLGGGHRPGWRDNNQGAVPCPAPGKACPDLWHDGTTRCCFDGDYESLTVTLPNN